MYVSFTIGNINIQAPIHSALVLQEKSTDNRQPDLIISSSRRDERVLSVEEVMVKQEKDLELARNTIRNLQAHLGTVIVSGDSDSDSAASMDVGDDVQAEVEQCDSLFAHQYTFKTNVRKFANLKKIHCTNVIFDTDLIPGKW